MFLLLEVAEFAGYKSVKRELAGLLRPTRRAELLLSWPERRRERERETEIITS